jgi:Arylsulfotransferase (ASST)
MPRCCASGPTSFSLRCKLALMVGMSTATVIGPLSATPAHASVAGDSAAIVVSSGTLSDVTVASTPAGVSMRPAFTAATQDYALWGCAGSTLTLTLTGTNLRVGSRTGSAISVQEHAVAGQAVIVSTPAGLFWFRCLPNDFPPLTVDSHGTTAPGWYVTAVVSNSGAPAPAGLYMMILDSRGTPVWYMPSSGTPAIDFQLLADSTLTWTHFGAGGFSTYRYDTQTFGALPTVPTPHWPSRPIVDVHELLRLPNGDDMFLVYPITTDDSASFTDATGATHNGVNINDCVIEEVSPTGRLVWSWDAYYDHHVSPSETFLGGALINGAYDVYHCNSLALDPTAADPSQADVLVSMRNTDAVYRIQRSTGRVLWKLGNDHASGPALTAAQTTGDDHEPLLVTSYTTGENTIGGQHDARFQAGDSSVSLYDDHTAQPATVHGARAVQFSIDMTRHTATETDDFPAPDSNSPAVATGSYRPNSSAEGGRGDNLVGWGFRNALALTEFDDAGRDLRDIYLNSSASSTTSSGNYWSVYRFIKLPPSAFSATLLRQSAGVPRTAVAPTAAGWNPPRELTLPRPLSVSGAVTSGVSAASPGNKWLDIVWKGADANLWHAWSIDGGITYGGPRSLGDGPLASAPRALSDEPGRIDVFWRGSDNHLRDARYTGGVGWSPAQTVGGSASMAGEPFPVSLGYGRADVFWKGSDGNLWHVTYSDSGGWSAAHSLGGGPLASDPRAASPGTGRVLAFWRGADGNLWDDAYSDSTGWSAAHSLGGGPLASPPYAVSPGSGSVDVVWRGSDDRLRLDSFKDASGWSGAESVGGVGTVTSPPTAVSPGGGDVDVFWRTTDPLSGSRTIDEARYTSDSGWTVGPRPSATSLTGDPWAIRSSSAGQVAVFARALDGAFWYQTSAAAPPGLTWSLVPSPNSGSAGNRLSSVSCVGTGDCWAVGQTGGAPLVEHYDGTAWSLGSAHAAAGSLDGVTCISAGNCWAAGSNAAVSPAQPLLEHYDGTGWAAIGGPAISTASALNSVTCTGAANCWAVGVQSGGRQALIEHFGGSAWTLSTSPPLAGASSLYGVGCSASSECWAVGKAADLPLIERYDGTTWIRATPQSRGVSDVLRSVFCFSATDCWAAGRDTDDSHLTQTLLEHYDQHGWAFGSSPNAGGSRSNNSLNGVVCTLYSDCWTVGWYTSGTAHRTLVERNSGSGWTFIPSPNRDAASSLNGIACPSPSRCWAVGYSVSAGIERTLIEALS